MSALITSASQASASQPSRSSHSRTISSWTLSTGIALGTRSRVLKSQPSASSRSWGAEPCTGAFYLPMSLPPPPPAFAAVLRDLNGNLVAYRQHEP